MGKSNLPNDIKEIYSVSGFHTINASKHIVEFSDKLPVYLNVYESFSTKFHHLSRRLTEQYKDISGTMLELSDCAKNFSNMYKITDNVQFSTLFKDIQSSLLKWAKVNEDISEICCK